MQPILNEVTDHLHESCSIAEISGQDIVYVARSAASRIMTVQISVGTQLAIYCTSMGKVLLAYQAKHVQTDFILKMNFNRGTEKSIATAKEMSARIELIRKQGYVVVDEELELGFFL